MANKLYEEENIRSIAEAIRTKNGTMNTYTVAQMADAVLALSADDSGDGIVPTGSIEITTNGTYDVTQYASATVNVPTESGGITPSGDITITQNGRFDVTNYAGAVVNVPTGGGGTSIGNWHTGTFTIEETETGDVVHTVVHNLGFTPIYIVVWADQFDDLTIHSGKALIGGHKLGNTQGHIRKTENSTDVSYNNYAVISNITESSFDFGGNGLGSVYIKPAGWTYRWFALG